MKLNAINRSCGSAVQHEYGAAADADLEIQHERGALDIKEGQRGVNVNLKELYFTRRNYVLALKIKGSAFNLV